MPNRSPAPPAPPPMNPASPPRSPDQSAYDFIMNEQPKRKRSWLPGGNSKQQRIFIFVGIVVVLLLVGLVLFALILQSSSKGTEDLLSITKQQTEIARVADFADEKARSSDTKTIGAVTALTMRSDQQANVAYMKSHHKKVSDKQLSTTKNAQTDALLTQAEQTNQFDPVFLKELAKELLAYQKAVKSVHDAATSRQIRAMLEAEFYNAGLLLKDKSLQATSTP